MIQSVLSVIFELELKSVNAVYAEAIRQFSVRSWDVLMNAQCPHKW